MLGQSGARQLALDGLLRRAVEDRRRDLEPERVRGVPEVGFEHLAEVHPARHAERVEHDLDGGAVGQVRHVLDRHDSSDDALVAVAAGHLVALRDLSLLGDVDADQLVDARGQLVIALAAEHLDVDDDAALAVRNAQRRVADLARLLTEDGAQQALFRGQLRLALRGDLADQDVARADLGADVDDAALVEVLQRLLVDVGDVARDLLRTELGVARLDLELLDVDRGELVLTDDRLADEDRVLEVVALPRHECHEHVAAERELSVIGRRTIGEDVAGADARAAENRHALRQAGALVAAHELVDAVPLVGATVIGAHQDADAAVLSAENLLDRAVVVRRLRPGDADHGARLARQHHLA